MPPYRELYRPPSSRAASEPRRVYVRAASPELEEFGFSTDLGDPASEPLGWNPLGWVASQATAAANVLQRAGEAIYDQVITEAKDLGSTLYAAATGEPPAEPGVIFNMASGISEAMFRLMPEALQKKLTVNNQSNIAGYITLADGTRIPVPKAQDTQAQGERALSSAAHAALTKANADIAATRSRERLESQKLAATNDQFDRNFALKERSAAQQQRLFDLQERALELALERETSSPAQRALWGRPSTLDTKKEQPQRAIRAIGPGLAGAPIEIGLGPAWGRMVGD